LLLPRESLPPTREDSGPALKRFARVVSEKGHSPR
jgi:hypothetical protein